MTNQTPIGGLAGRCARIAVLDVDSEKPDAFTDGDRAGLETIVGLIAE